MSTIPTDDLRRLIAQATKGEMVVQTMNSRRDHVLLSTVRPVAQVGMFLDNASRPEDVAAFRAVANAEFCKASYEWMPKLLDEVARLQALVDAEEVELATKAAGGARKK